MAQPTNSKPQRDQFIALCADSQSDALALLPAAQLLSTRFRKGLLLLTCSPDADQWVASVGIPFVALKSDWPSAVQALPVAFNAVLAIVPYDVRAPRGAFANPRQLKRNIRQSKIAYIAMPLAAVADGLPALRNVALTLDHQRESKEKLLWASYMARFCGSSILVLHQPYTDQTLLSRCHNNIRYLDKVFSSLSLDYSLRQLPQGKQYGNPDLKAVGLADWDLFVAMVPDIRNSDLVDLLTPSLAVRLLQRVASRPILFLNQRDDLYVLCD